MRSRRGAVVRRCAGNGHSPGKAQDALEVGVSPGEMASAEDSAYIRLDSVTELPVYVWSVTGSLLFGSPSDVHGAYSSRTWVVLVEIWLSCRFVWWA